MASLTKKIKKRADRFSTALAAVEKHFAQAQIEAEATGDARPDNSFEKFDLSAAIALDIKEKEDAKRKARNKRKAEMRKRKGN